MAIPMLEYSDSYEPLITELQWWPDSKSILFLGQRSCGRRRLYRANVLSGEAQPLTPEDYDVTQFKLGARGIAYKAARKDENRIAEAPTNAGTRNVTGLPLTSILFPKMARTEEPLELWVLRDGKNRRITDPETGRPIRLTNLPPPPYEVLSLSPDAKSAVVLVPSETIPSSWEAYEPVFGYLRLQKTDSDASAQIPLEQYALVNLVTGKTTTLVNAPNAWALGSADMNQAVWSSDKRKLLLTNTYLPLEGVSEPERSRRVHHCAAAIIDFASKANSCVSFSTSDREKKHLLAGSFGENDEEVVLRFWNAPNTTTEERFRYENDAWKSTGPLSDWEEFSSALPHSKGAAETRSVTVRQDLNTPPALWATDRETGQSKRIWDPNPQLAALNLGEASEIHWKDKSGYEWIGGLVKPPGYVPGKRYPLVIQTHGFQASEFMTDGAFTTAFAARPLASHGIMVLQMPTRRDHLVTAEEASDQIQGIESAIERLAAEELIDPKKVGIIGFSRTCYYVECALIKDPKRFAAATLADGIDESYMQYLLFGVGRSHEESEQIYGSAPFGDGLKRWTEHAPGFHLDRIETPVRLEAITPASVLEEWEIYASLWKQGKAVDLIYFPGGQHILQKPRERLASQQGNTDWFCFWLKGEEDADPRKAEQYARWRRLRARDSARNGQP